MKNFSLMKKLLAGNLIIAAIVVAASCTGLYLVNTVVGVLSTVTDHAAPLVVADCCWTDEAILATT